MSLLQSESEPSHTAVVPHDSTGLIRLPPDSVFVEDPEEEVFLLYTHLSTRQAPDISSSSFIGLGSVDSRQDTLAVRFTLPQLYPQRPRVVEREEGRESHATKRHGKRNSSTLKSKSLQNEERILEVNLLQDKTSLRSKKGDTGSVLWRVSVALAQVLLGELCSNSPISLFDAEKLKGCNVLELGSGTGLLALVLAPWVRRYTATDLDYLVPLIRKNVAANLPTVQQTLKPAKSTSSPSSRYSKRSAPTPHSPPTSATSEGPISVESLDWLALQHTPLHRRKIQFHLVHADPPDVIVLADCVYNTALLPALLSVVDYYAEAGRTRVLVAVELRAVDVVRDFLVLWAELGGWEIWRVGNGRSERDDGDGDGWLGVGFAVWVGWKLNILLSEPTDAVRGDSGL